MGICDEFTAREYEGIKYVGTIPQVETSGSINFPDCGSHMTSECFWQNYKQSGWLDLMSFLMMPQALLGCAVHSNYDYGLCFSNYPYVLIDSFSKKIAPGKLALDEEETATEDDS